MEVTLLTKEQIWDEPLSVINKFGRTVLATDLTALLGVDMYDDGFCETWTQSDDGDSDDTGVRLCDYDGSKDASYANENYYCAIRPVLPPEVTKNLTPDTTRKGHNGTTIVEWGEYPQTVADKKTQEKLEELWEDSKLKETQKKYTLNHFGVSKGEFRGTSHEEYEYKGKRYIRVDARNCDEDSKLANGEMAENGDTYWVEVQPIEWLQDPSGYWVAKHALISGIPFEKGPNYNADFKETFMYAYLQKYFANEMVNTNAKPRARKQTKEEKKLQDRLAARQAKYGIKVVKEPLSLDEQLRRVVESGQSCMLHGPSGVGKTQHVKKIDPDLVPLTLCNGILPEDVKGRVVYPSQPNAEGKLVGQWVPPVWYTELCEKCAKEPNRTHVLFIDELTNASEHTQALIYKLAEERSIDIGRGKLPDNAVVVFAGNSKEESSAAYNMPEPLFRRMAHFHLDLNLEEWLRWGSERNEKDPDRLHIHPLISGFVATYAQEVLHTTYDEDEQPKFALDPRKWEMVSNYIYNSKGEVQKDVLASFVGEGIANSLVAYAQNPPLCLEEVVDGEYTEADIPQTPDAKLALALNLQYATPKQVGVVRDFIDKNLGAENRAVFDSLWAGKDPNRALQIKRLKDAKSK